MIPCVCSRKLTASVACSPETSISPCFLLSPRGCFAYWHDSSCCWICSYDLSCSFDSSLHSNCLNSCFLHGSFDIAAEIHPQVIAISLSAHVSSSNIGLFFDFAFFSSILWIIFAALDTHAPTSWRVGTPLLRAL